MLSVGDYDTYNFELIQIQLFFTNYINEYYTLTKI